MLREPAADVQPRLARWTKVFAANCLIPGFFGIGICMRGGGLVGMFLGTLFLWLFSLFLVKHSWFLNRSLVLGGTVLACMQIVPIVQLLAGMLAMGLWYRIHLQPPDPAGIRM